MQTNGRRDMTKLIVPFRNFVKAPTKSQRTSFAMSCKSIPVWFFTDWNWKRVWIIFHATQQFTRWLSFHKLFKRRRNSCKNRVSENKLAEGTRYFYRQINAYKSWTVVPFKMGPKCFPETSVNIRCVTPRKSEDFWQHSYTFNSIWIFE